MNKFKEAKMKDITIKLCGKKRKLKFGSSAYQKVKKIFSDSQTI